MCSRVLETVNFEAKFSSLPQFRPDQCCQSPSAIPNTSPRVFVQSYRKKSIAEEEALALTPLEPPTSAATVENLSSGNSVASARLVGHTFFPPDFNPENPFRGEQYSESTNRKSKALHGRL
jgi:hypothetical protein